MVTENARFHVPKDPVDLNPEKPLHLIKIIVVSFLTCTVSTTAFSQSTGQAPNGSETAGAKATRRLIELCQDPDVSPESIESAIRDGADLEAHARVPVPT